MRLIDADSIKFVEYINGDITVSKEAIRKIPTAYDEEKVVEQLKEKVEYAENKAAEYDEKGDIPMMDIWEAKAKAYKNAIEIVKSGGVVMEVEDKEYSEEIFEWLSDRTKEYIDFLSRNAPKKDKLEWSKKFIAALKFLGDYGLEDKLKEFESRW